MRPSVYRSVYERTILMATNVANPFPNPILKKSDLDDESLTLLNQVLANLTKGVNDLSGINGPINLSNHINLGGNRIQNVGAPESPTDAIPNNYASDTYGAKALAPAFNALGKQVMQTYRQLSNPDQREQYSSFLNKILNTAPTSNTSFVDFTPPSGGTITATVTSGLHQRVDGSVVPYAARTDTLTLPTAYTITAIARSAGIVTVTTSVATGLTVGDGFTVSGVADASYDGTFVILTIVGTTITYSQGGPSNTSSGGHLSVGGVYYYTLSHGQSQLGLVGGFSSDTWSNRVQASFDQTTIIAVVVTNSSGGDPLNSAGGGTPPQQGTAIVVIRRL
jgi:hypothetical protein